MLIGTNVIVFVVLALCGAAYGYVQFQFDQIKRVSILGITVEGKGSQSQTDPGSSIPPFTLLAVGSDTRNIPGGSAFQGSGANATAGQRSDSIILMRVNPAAHSIALLSIPRDTIVPIPGMGTTRVNSAFDSGNPNLLVKVLQQDFGIEVNHYAETNFDTFEQLANAVGGVNVWFPAPAKDDFSLFKMHAGCANLSGLAALAFVRSREYQYYLNGSWHYQALPESDLARIQRQQAFIKLALQKARQVAPTNITELNSLVSSVTSNLTLDSTFSNSELLSLAQTFRSANLGNIPQFTFPTVNSTTVPGALDPLKTQGAAVVAQWLAVGQPAPGSTPSPSTPKSTATTAPVTTVVAPSSVKVEVANGSGVSGQAAKAATTLQGLGYPTTVTQTRYTPVQQTTLVLYAPDAKAAATQLQAQLGGAVTIQVDSALTPTPYALELVTGADGVATSGATAGSGTGSSSTGSSSTTTPASTTTVPADPAITGATNVEPDSSSYVNGVYIPPGRTATQPVVTCPN